MSERLDALRTVERNIRCCLPTTPETQLLAFGSVQARTLAGSAFYESVDAGLELLGLVCPNWSIERLRKWPGGVASAELWGTHEADDGSRWHHYGDGRVEEESSVFSLSVVLLLAIIQALISEETSNG